MATRGTESPNTSQGSASSNGHDAALHTLEYTRTRLQSAPHGEDQTQVGRAVARRQQQYAMSPNILMVDNKGARMEALEDVLTRYERSGATAGIARRERGVEGRDCDFSLNSVCSPASFSIVDADKHASPVEGLSPIAGQVMDYLSQKFRKDPQFHHESVDRFANWILRLCQEFSSVVTAEPVFLRLKSPIYILGDIHGNFADLYFYLSQLLPFGHMKYCANQFLFLGDYVDRGAFGIEVVAYLFAMKCLQPSSVYLLRGNHELFTINGDEAHYGDGSFKQQCIRKFGPQRGDDVWVAVNEAFKLLPIAATVDDKIFCAHGGIPRYFGGEDNRLKLLSDPSFPRFNSTHPQQGDNALRARYREIAMDVLWNDPSDDEQGLNEYGFGVNARGPNTYTFGNKAIEMFLQNHGFEYIIRAHELKQTGLRIAKSAKVITVFTSSGYCGGDNGSGAVFVSNGKMRLLSCVVNASQLPNHAFGLCTLDAGAGGLGHAPARIPAHPADHRISHGGHAAGGGGTQSPHHPSPSSPTPATASGGSPVRRGSPPRGVQHPGSARPSSPTLRPTPGRGRPTQ
eukprot:TRINITY_DN6104_c0_g1_i1.p1 TRINITY_DN6104_c0_g1~~TRINITY_DN6104_c0_g1_i1.p1  ORF type:complete len:587 (-),score=59.19 TRINITY_DN6104_c0_g1_i1:168-1880(-)